MSAAPSLAALFPNSEASSSAKKRQYTYREWVRIVRHSFARPSIKRLTLNALTARGPWPESDGPAHGIIFLSIDAMMVGDEDGDGACARSTAQRRLKRAVKEQFWRVSQGPNSWMGCPKCGKERTVGKCEGCGYRGRSKDPKGNWTGEFMRVPGYEIDIEKFRSAPPPKAIRHFCARTWKEHKEAAKRGEHPNVTEMPRQTPPEQTPPPKSPAPVRREEPQRKTAEHQKERTVVNTEISQRAEKAARLIIDLCGLPDPGIGPSIVSAVLSEARWKNLEIEDAAMLLKDCIQRDQKNNIAITRFYFRDGKWRTNGGQTSPAVERSRRIKESIAYGIRKALGSPDVSDGGDCEGGT